MNYSKDSNIKQARQAYQKATNLLYKSEQAYNSILKKNNCFDCAIYEMDSQKKFEVRHKKCSTCKRGAKVITAYNNYAESSQKVDLLLSNYANVIFNVLKEDKPKLIHRRTNKVMKWEDVFPSSFKSVTPALRNALIALIEEEGGAYRIKQSLFSKLFK